MKDSLNHTIFAETDCLSEQTLFDYIDKKLNAKESHVVERHLLSCELCSDAIEGLEMLKDRNRISTIKSEVSKRISVPTKETKIISINYKAVLSIAASVLLLIGGIFFFNLLSNKNEMAALKQDEATLPPPPPSPPPASTNEESEVVSESVLPEAPKEKSAEGSGQKPLENRNTLTENHLSKNAPFKNEPATINNSVSNNIDMSSSISASSGTNGTSEINESENANITLADDGMYDSEKDSKKTATSEEKPVMASAPLRAEKALAEGAGVAIDKYEADDALAKTSKKTSGNKKESEAKKQNSTIMQQAAPSTNGIIDEQQKDVTTSTEAGAFYSAYNSELAQTETSPEYPGGQDSLISFIRNNFNKQLTNKNEALAKQLAEVKLIVDKKGKVINPIITKGLNTELNKELLRVLQLLPKWKPATINGEKVAKEVTLPIQLVK